MFLQHAMPRPPPSPPCIRLVLDFHFVLERAGLHQVLAKVEERWALALQSAGLCASLGVAWRGSTRPLAPTLRVLGSRSTQ